MYCDECCQNKPANDRNFTRGGGFICDDCREIKRVARLNAKTELGVQAEKKAEHRRNPARVRRAESTIIAYAEKHGKRYLLDEERQTHLVDLLADLMHYAKSRGKMGVDFEAALESARNHFEAEA